MVQCSRLWWFLVIRPQIGNAHDKAPEHGTEPEVYTRGPYNAGAEANGTAHPCRWQPEAPHSLNWYSRSPKKTLNLCAAWLGPQPRTQICRALGRTSPARHGTSWAQADPEPSDPEAVVTPSLTSSKWQRREGCIPTDARLVTLSCERGDSMVQRFRNF